MNKVYISKKNFDIVENPDVIAVDESLANIICKFNKKGYLTRTHHCIDSGYDPKYIVYYSDYMGTLDKIKLDSDNKMEIVNDDYYMYSRKYKNANIIIEFKRDYKFKEVPEGFDYLVIERKHFKIGMLRCNISIVNKDGNWIIPTEYESIKNKHLKNLEDWIDKLPVKKGL